MSNTKEKKSYTDSARLTLQLNYSRYVESRNCVGKFEKQPENGICDKIVSDSEVNKKRLFAYTRSNAYLRNKLFMVRQGDDTLTTTLL